MNVFFVIVIFNIISIFYYLLCVRYEKGFMCMWWRMLMCITCAMLRCTDAHLMEMCIMRCMWAQTSFCTYYACLLHRCACLTCTATCATLHLYMHNMHVIATLHAPHVQKKFRRCANCACAKATISAQNMRISNSSCLCITRNQKCTFYVHLRCTTTCA